MCSCLVGSCPLQLSSSLDFKSSELYHQDFHYRKEFQNHRRLGSSLHGKSHSDVQ